MNFLYSRYVLLMLSSCITFCKSDDYIVKIDQGRLRGRQDKDVDGNKFFLFQGIPYAKPPVGDLRFKNPQEPESWGDDIFNATSEGNVCFSMQISFTLQGLRMKPQGSEDCLVLNIFTHAINNVEQLRPVMVFIHGGAFITGSSKKFLYGPEFLMTQDIVLVTFNYRLGALGFLNFKDPSVDTTGNAGMKDMVQALKWVKKNIKQFGGDPEKVTIFGESAGSAAVELLTLSPMSKGLFHRAILQSGSALNLWSIAENDPVLFAKAMNYSGPDNEKEVLEFLLKADQTDILNAQIVMEPTLGISKQHLFAPTIEIETANSFLTKDPRKILLSGDYSKVPLIIGYNSLEGLIIEGFEMIGITINREEPIPWNLGYKKFDSNYNETFQKLIQHYFGGGEYDVNNKDVMFQASGDLMIVKGIHDSIRIRAKTSPAPLYVYRMSIETKLNVFKIFAGITHEGVSHGDDLGYLFKITGTSKGKNGSAEDIAFRKFVKLWTNFAKTGNPTPEDDPLLNVEWKPNTDADNIAYLDIGNELVMRKNPDSENVKFWDSIFGDTFDAKEA